jgi:hypothetical protein
VFKFRIIVGIVVALGSLLAISALPQQNPRELFERARMLDESNQNLTEAIKLYRQVVTQAKDQRALAARVKDGLCRKRTKGA